MRTSLLSNANVNTPNRRDSTEVTEPDLIPVLKKHFNDNAGRGRLLLFFSNI